MFQDLGIRVRVYGLGLQGVGQGFTNKGSGYRIYAEGLRFRL